LTFHDRETLDKLLENKDKFEKEFKLVGSGS
jgi:hypothetical protein